MPPDRCFFSPNLKCQWWSDLPTSSWEHFETLFNLEPHSNCSSFYCCSSHSWAASRSSLWLKTSGKKSYWYTLVSKHLTTLASPFQTLFFWWMCEITWEVVVNVPPGIPGYSCAALWLRALKCTCLWAKRLYRLLHTAGELSDNVVYFDDTLSTTYHHIPSRRVVDERVGQGERSPSARSTAAKATQILAQPVFVALSRRERVPLEVGERVCTYLLNG